LIQQDGAVVPRAAAILLVVEQSESELLLHFDLDGARVSRRYGMHGRATINPGLGAEAGADVEYRSEWIDGRLVTTILPKKKGLLRRRTTMGLDSQGRLEVRTELSGYATKHLLFDRDPQ
jgi:hypothetical protein